MTKQDLNDLMAVDIIDLGVASEQTEGLPLFKGFESIESDSRSTSE